MKINFLKPIWNAHLKAVGIVIKRGKTIGLTECDVTDEENNLVARATCTQMTLRGNKAEGR
ncbi:MAG: PaaI family thioesterase [Chloroflexi bacterium]|nr:PaaI family thioesterase [Chloroflexota bacterium]